MNMSIWEKYLKKITKEQSGLVVKYLELAKKFSPGSVEELPYGVPGLKLNGKGLIAIAAHKNHLGIYPFSPSVVGELRTKLENAEFSEGTIRFKYDHLPTDSVIKMIVDQRQAEIR
jgi:uncharacterized protein YdhG (YjbR/CyaY superfamily)